MKKIIAIVSPIILGLFLWVTPVSAADSPWVGVWRVADTEGKSYTIELYHDGKVLGSRDGGMSGKWKEIDGNVYVVWKTGWRTLLFSTGDGYGKMSFKPGKNFHAAPDTVTVAVRD